jgi:hypothetical protein
LAKGRDPALNGGLPEPRMLFTGTLVNSNLDLALLVPGAEAEAEPGVRIDHLLYGPAVAEGRSIQLRPGLLDAVSNDLPANWRVSVDAGTPGAANVE